MSVFALVWLLALPSGAIQPARVISGTVEDLAGGAAAGATVTVECGATVAETTADADGAFEVGGLPSRRCLVMARLQPFAPATAVADLTDDSASVHLVLALAIESQVVVTPSRGQQEDLFRVPEAVSVSARDEIQVRPGRVLPDVLREQTGLLIQQSTTAQGSSFIRGLSAQRVVYLLDGIRFNTSTFRAGATQYLAWIDPSVVDRVEVLRGPSSVQYGSDALGGSLNVLTLGPTLRSDTRVTGLFDGAIASADRGGAVGGALSVEGRLAALRAGGAARGSRDLRTGGGRDSRAAVTRFLGLASDTVDTRLPGTDYAQTSGHLSAVTRMGDAVLSGLYLHTEQFDVTRVHRELGGDGLHRSEFEPQRLDVGGVRFERSRVGRLSAFSGTFSFNRQQDDRLEQARPSTEIEREATRTLALGYQAQATWPLDERHVLVFGGEAYDEHIAATRMFEDPDRRTREAVRPRVPDGTRYTSTGLFAQTTSDLVPGRLLLRAGVRYGSFVFTTRADRELDVEAERVAVGAATFHTGLVVGIIDSVNATLTVSRGFRAANAFDLGAIGISGGGFEITAREGRTREAELGTTDGLDAVTTGRLVADLTPESGYSFEAGLRVRTPRWSGTIRVFDLELFDLIQRRTAIFSRSVVGDVIAGREIVRQDEAGRAFIAEDPRPLVTRANVARARISGLETEAAAQIVGGWSTAGYFSLARGHELETGTFLRRMPPSFGGVRLRWAPVPSPWWIEGVTTFALAQTRLSPGDLTDARIGATRSRDSIAQFFNGTATDLGLVVDGVLVTTDETLADVQQRVLGGAALAPLYARTPGFVTVGARTGWQVSERFELILIADNLMDRNYRWHGSGVDGTGVDVQLRTRYRF